MDALSPAHQPDEGYSEDPLNPSTQYELSTALSTLKSPSDLPAWISTNAAHLPSALKQEIAMALLNELPTSALSGIVQQLNPRLYINFVRYLPPEICLKVLNYLDPTSLVNVICTCRDWGDLALDSKLWERMYHLEGWKAIRSEIETWEERINTGLNESIAHLNRTQDPEGRSNKIRALGSEDEDVDVSMSDDDHDVNADSATGGSIFGATASSSLDRASSVRQGDMDLDASPPRRKGNEKPVSFTESRARQREQDANSETPVPPVLSPTDPKALRPSTLWIWDSSQSRYRINWKHLYNMRRRLEANWELGKAVTFQFPHPNHPEEGHRECIYTLQFDANHAVTGSRDQTMRIWDFRTSRLMCPPLVGHRGSVLCLQFDADPEEDLLVSGSSDSDIIVWKFSTGEILQRITGGHRTSVLNVRFDKRVIVTSSKDKSIKIFNRKPLRYGDTGYHDDMVYPMARHLRRYGYEPELAQELPVKNPYSVIGRLEGHTAAVNAIQIRDDTVVSVSGDRHIKVWNWPKQVCVQTIPAHEKGIACVEYDGRRIVSGSSDCDICIFDASTGLKVATLQGHRELVRSVQAGFGDLPYSLIEDEAEARRVDAEYFRAVEAGEIEHNPNRRERRRPNAGSSHPADLQAFGAKLPPGGGGGRKYGRIVSGSYDQSIIIWRRDKEGVWKPAHHLRQEEAAAEVQAAAATGPPIAPGGVDNLSALLPDPATLPSFISSLGATPQRRPDRGGKTSRPNFDAQPHISAGLYRALIDQVIPAGPTALQRALTNYPRLLTHHNYLNVVIEREASRDTRAELRRVVADTLVFMQSAQQHNAPASDSSMAANPGGTTSPDTLLGGHSGEQNADQTTPTPATATPQPQPAQTATQTPNPAPQEAVQGQGNAPPAQDADGAAPPAPNVAQPPPHHGSRIFKVQFDARKIVCCRGAPVVVGWDFCNGDPELEEASRFFATVD